MLGVFRTWNLHMAERRSGVATVRETGGESVARLARRRLRRRTIASVRAHSCVSARFHSNRRHIADNRRLLSPVMVLPTPWFVSRFPAITGEIFSARNVSRAGNAVLPGRALKEPARAIPSRLHGLLKTGRVHVVSQGRTQANPQGAEALFRKVKLLNSQEISERKFFRENLTAKRSVHRQLNTKSVPYPPRAGEASRARRRARCRGK